jgi:hypothetical protein
MTNELKDAAVNRFVILVPKSSGGPTATCRLFEITPYFGLFGTFTGLALGISFKK